MDDVDDDMTGSQPPSTAQAVGGAPPVALTIPPESAGARLDKALADAVDASLGFSRSRLRALIEGGAVTLEGAPALDASRKVKGGERAEIAPPAPAPVGLTPEAIPLEIHYEDDALIVLEKPAGMAVHPGPGNETGTLVNALLGHCGDRLSGIGGEARPGIVHRIDKETSGLLVVAKTDAAHQGLSRQFAAHDLERSYLALCWGAPERTSARLAGLPSVTMEPGWIRIDAPVARHPTDRKRMAVARDSARGRRATTRVRALERFGAALRPEASLVECRLETGRTHQIRVHLTHIGHGLIGDPVYGRGARKAQCEAAAAFPRQALHAATLGFRHPISDAALRFDSAPPADFQALLDALRDFAPPE